VSVGAPPYIERVFENDLVELGAAGTLAAAEANEHTLITAETRRLQIAAHWADLHPGEAVARSRLPGTEHPVRLGGDGTPTVGGFAAAELGCVLRMSDGSAARLIGDALDLRHRLRGVWAAARAGQVPAYQARTIAKATRHLTLEQTAAVDARIAPSLGALPWGRVQTLLAAAIVEADPDGAEQQAADAARERFVRLGRKSEHGLKLIIARATAGDAIWFKATIDRIAEILAKRGDTDTIKVRRSKAIGILAQPAQALQLLCQHQDDDWDGPAEPAEPDEEATEPTEPDEEPAPEEEFGFDEAPPQHDADLAADLAAGQPAGAAAADPTVDGEPHRSLQILPPPFGPAAGPAPRRGLCTPQRRSPHRRHRCGPRRKRRPSLARPAPPAARRALHHPSETGHRPASRAHPNRCLRNPRQPPRTTAAALPHRRLPLRRRRQPNHRRGPHHPLPEPRPRRTARPNPARQPRPPHPPPPVENPRRLAGPTTRTRHLAVAITPPQDLISSTPPAATPSATPHSQQPSGAPP
jgi:hypothetical protein